VFSFCPGGRGPGPPAIWWHRSAISFPFGSASRARTPRLVVPVSDQLPAWFSFSPPDSPRWVVPVGSWLLVRAPEPRSWWLRLGSSFSSWWLRVGFACLPGAVLARGAETPGAPAISGTGQRFSFLCSFSPSQLLLELVTQSVARSVVNRR